MKLAVICNHQYPDMQEFFQAKARLKSSKLGSKLSFLTCYSVTGSDDISRIPSCFSRKPFFDFLLLVDLFYGPLLALFLRLCGFKVIHFTTTHFSNLPVAILFRLLGGSVLSTVHRFDLESYDPLRRVLLTCYEKLIFLLSEKIIILSDNERVPPIKKVVIKMAGYKQQVTKSKATADYFMFFGRIDDYKGLEDIFSLARDLPNANFVVAGNGFSPAISDLECLENVTVINRFIDDSELKGLFDGAYLVLLPYKSISQSAVQILSYSYATPVVCYDIGNLSEFIVNGVTGYLVPSCDYSSFKKAVESFKVEDLSTMSRNCITYFSDNFSDDVLYKQNYEFYSQTLLRTIL